MKHDRAVLALAAVAAIAAAYLVVRWRQDQAAGAADAGPEPGSGLDWALPSFTFVEDAVSSVKSFLQLWRPPAQYAQLIADAEDRYAIPRDLLARLLYQESRYRQDIITGQVKSPVGALGIAQFMPATAAEMGIDPLNPAQAIDGAGRYLAKLYGRTGSWTEALAAYNWGIGNVTRKGLAVAPLETRNYFTQILADVNAANGTQLA